MFDLGISAAVLNDEVRIKFIGLFDDDFVTRMCPYDFRADLVMLSLKLYDDLLQDCAHTIDIFLTQHHVIICEAVKTMA